MGQKQDESTGRWRSMHPRGSGLRSSESSFALAASVDSCVPPSNYWLKCKSAIRERLLKNNNHFARFGVAKLFPGEAFDGFGIVAQRVEGRFQLLRSFFLLLDLYVQAQHFFA